MERTPAACAINWSIDLEKNLRSKNPGKRIETLKEISCQLEWWNNEAELEVSEYRMFGLIPGEDKLFLNAIFLRLADTFRFGSRHVKLGVVELFRRIRRKEGILSKGKLENYVELLRRVKEVFDGGDVEERGLALVLFGCWAYFANDSADIRYIVLSSLVSSDALEVQAALFAAGCFCELSDDFAHVFLEILTTLVNSPEAPRGMKMAGARAFSRMWCSFSVAEKAYKTGFTLLMESTDDNFSEVMLISLSRIAAKWMLLIPNQIELLTLFLSEERSLHMKTTSLKCHLIILARVCNFPFSMEIVHKLFGILQRSDYPSMQLEALKVLHKIILSNLSISHSMEMPEIFRKLLLVVENMLHSSILPTKAIAGRVLSDLSEKLFGRADIMSGQTASLASQVISFVFDQIFILITTRVELDVKILLSLISNLVEKHSHLRCLVLNNICLFIDKLMKMPDKENTGLSDVEFSVESKVLFDISKIVGVCLRNLEETNSETSLILDALKLQLENVCNYSYIDSYTCVSYFLLLQLHGTFIYFQHIGEEYMSCADSFFRLDILAENHANRLLERNSYWSCYKSGKIAASQGAWSTSALVFERLRTVVQSASCSSWLKSLALFSTSEKQTQLFLLHNQDPSSGSKMNYCAYMENFLTMCDTLLSAEEILAASDLREMFSFQRWFLILRAKFLKSIADIMKLLDGISSVQDGSVSVRQLEKRIIIPCTISNERFASLVYTSTQISFQMRKLAQEFDLLLTSSIGIDRYSGMTISSLALTCSLMAFTVGFAFVIPNMGSSENNGVPKFGELEGPFHPLLIEDLFGRLRIEHGIRTNFLFLLKALQTCKRCFLPRFRSQITNATYEAGFLQKLSEYSVREIVAMQSKERGAKLDGDVILHTVSDGSQHLFNIISRLMLIPFRTPHHFFRVRPCVSSELFVMDEDGKYVDGASVLAGSHLSLNLCLQLKTVPASLQGRLKKLFCVLGCKRHSQVMGEHKGQQDHFSGRDEETCDMVELNEKLMRYAVSVESHGLHSKGEVDHCGMAVAYACFQLNRKGQGFSSCLLNVSALPVASYSMKFLCGCIDVSGSYWSFLPVNTGPLFTVH